MLLLFVCIFIYVMSKVNNRPMCTLESKGAHWPRQMCILDFFYPMCILDVQCAQWTPSNVHIGRFSSIVHFGRLKYAVQCAKSTSHMKQLAIQSTFMVVMPLLENPNRK